jgi:hypothetical protein
MITHVKVSQPRLFGLDDVFDMSDGIRGIMVGATLGVFVAMLFIGTPGVPSVGALLAFTSIVFATGGFIIGSLLGCCL